MVCIGKDEVELQYDSVQGAFLSCPFCCRDLPEGSKVVKDGDDA